MEKEMFYRYFLALMAIVALVAGFDLGIIYLTVTTPRDVVIPPMGQISQTENTQLTESNNPNIFEETSSDFFEDVTINPFE